MNLPQFTRRIVKINGKVISNRTPEEEAQEQERLQREYDRTHPPQVERISGCCDPAE